MTRLLLLAVLLVAVAAQADDLGEAQRLFALGVELAEEGDHRGAIAAFDAARATGWTSPGLALNLSGSYLSVGDLGRARLHVERAVRLAPRDAEARHHLRLVRRAVGEPPARSPTAVQAAIAWTGGQIGAGWAVALALALWVALAVAVGVRLWTGAWSVALRRGTLVLAAVAIAALVLAVAVAHDEARPRAVTLASAPLQAGPSADGATMGALAPGRLVALGRRQGTWQAVRLPDGTEVWTQAAMLEPLDG